MEWTTIGLAVFSTVMAPSTGYVIRQGLAAAKRLTAVEGVMRTHETLDAERFKGIGEHLTLIRNEQVNQTQKLDRLVEKFL